MAIVFNLAGIRVAWCFSGSLQKQTAFLRGDCLKRSIQYPYPDETAFGGQGSPHHKLKGPLFIHFGIISIKSRPPDAPAPA